MKKIAIKLITISSQLLVVSLFLILLFSSEEKNGKDVTVDNNNFDKMADSVSFLFREDELFKGLATQDDNVIVSLTEEEEENKEVEENTKEEVIPDKEDTSFDTPEEEPSGSRVEDYPSIGDAIYGNLTGYGPDCYGCSGHTSSGYDVKNTIYYDDAEYGTIRIVAADKSFPLYSVFRISDVPGMEPFIAIALDRGGNVGYGKGTLFDLLFLTEKDPNILGLTKNVKFELLRSGK